MAGLFSVVDSSWELIDPNPDIHQLFQQFNESFFDGRLGGVYVQWSPRMTLCAGTCKFHPRNRECSIQLSKPLLSYRARKDLVETLLHEMIHAFLFIADGNRERESHGPKFHEHMYRINKMTGANITVYHTFHDEVSHFKTHWWKCNGPCQHRHPFYGIVKRSMNRAPGPNDFWYKDHQANCGGTFVKIKEPSPKKGVKRKKEAGGEPPAGVENKSKNKITNYFGRPSPVPESTAQTATATPTQGTSTQATVPPPPAPEPETFTGRGFILGSIGNSTQPSSSTSSSLFGSSSTSTSTSLSSGNKLGTSTSQQRPPLARGEHPLLAKWKQNYKTPVSSSSGRSAPPTSSSASATTGSQTTRRDFSSSTSTTSSTSSAIRESKKCSKPIEVIDLE